MSKKRIKVSAAYNDFTKKIKQLRSFDEKNQNNFNKKLLSKSQLYILTESAFFSGFREYENFIRDVFLLYSQGKPRTNGDIVTTYLNPTDFFHAEKLIKSSMHFLDWNTPDTIIARSELYLKNGFPFKQPYITNKAKLLDYKKIRNHIAHNSPESLGKYKNILISYYGTLPLKIPSVGEYLVLTSKNDINKYNLIVFFDLMEDMAINII